MGYTRVCISMFVVLTPQPALGVQLLPSREEQVLQGFCRNMMTRVMMMIVMIRFRYRGDQVLE